MKLWINWFFTNPAVAIGLTLAIMQVGNTCQRLFIIFIKSKYRIGMNLFKHEQELCVDSIVIPESVFVDETSVTVSVLAIFSKNISGVSGWHKHSSQ